MCSRMSNVTSDWSKTLILWVFFDVPCPAAVALIRAGNSVAFQHVKQSNATSVIFFRQCVNSDQPFLR